MIKKIILLTIAAFSLMACDSPNTGEPIEVEKHSILVYMVGDNSLSNYCEENIKSIQAGLADVSTENSVYVYYDNHNSEPKLLKLYKSKGTVVSNVVRTYDDINSASPERMTEVIYDAFASDTATSYGLILWSHASGWLPPNFVENNYNNGFITPFSFGEDDKNEMSLQDLALALPNNFFDYIIFDACLMGGVESHYQLRNKANYILAATSEVPAVGLPYDLIIPQLLGYSRNITQVANTCFEHITKELGRGIALGLVNANEFENLANVVASIYSAHHGEIFDISNVQHFDRYFTFYAFYDLVDYIKLMATDLELEILQEQLKKTVLYSKSTSDVYGITVKTYCGLSTYIYGADINTELDSAYQHLDWYNTVH